MNIFTTDGKQRKLIYYIWFCDKHNRYRCPLCRHKKQYEKDNEVWV